jgi:hypothetical protein
MLLGAFIHADSGIADLQKRKGSRARFSRTLNPSQTFLVSRVSLPPARHRLLTIDGSDPL